MVTDRRAGHRRNRLWACLFVLCWIQTNSAWNAPPAVADSLRRAETDSLEGVFLEAVPYYAKVATRTMRHEATIIPKGYPSGVRLGVIPAGTPVTVLRVFANDTESRYTLRLRTPGGGEGYATAKFFKPLKGAGPRGKILFVHLQGRYEYEGNSREIRRILALYETYVKENPHSPYVPEALLCILKLGCRWWDGLLHSKVSSPQTTSALRAMLNRNLMKIMENRFCEAACRQKIPAVRALLPAEGASVSFGPLPPALWIALEELERTLPASLSQP
uniref:SH3 domain-containing protein n=1 Tax=Desulfacinum infernum TaxID=35837 RepID=A0A832A305_9BACT